jgi:hypothetical protein
MMRLFARSAVFLVVLSVASCRDPNTAKPGSTTKPAISKTLLTIAGETGLIFPAGSKLIRFSEANVVVDPVWVAKITMPASSYDGFQQALLKKPTDNTDVSGALADSTSWWNPTDVVVTKQYLADSHTLVIVVVSKEGEEIAVYIEHVVF